MYRWPVMKLCEKQLRDINPSDVLDDGLFRKCNTYKGGGGYDQFPLIYKKRYCTDEPLNWQFVVQLKGCPFLCPYCYVTQVGVSAGECVEVPTKALVSKFQSSGLKVFHLMGGAPATYLKGWPDLLKALDGTGAVFHSDFLLAEHAYRRNTLDEISMYPRQLHAVSIKGTPTTMKKNCGAEPSISIMLENIRSLLMSNVPFYITFTGMPESDINWWRELLTYEFGPVVLRDSFSIDIRHYKALED